MPDLRHFLPSDPTERFSTIVEATQTGELQAAVIDSLNPYYLAAPLEVYLAGKLINQVIPTLKELDAAVKPCAARTIVDTLEKQQISRLDASAILVRAHDSKYVTRSSADSEPPSNQYQLTRGGLDLHPTWMYEDGKPVSGCAGGLAIGGLAAAMNTAVLELKPLTGIGLFVSYAGFGSLAVCTQTAKRTATHAHSAYLERSTK